MRANRSNNLTIRQKINLAGRDANMVLLEKYGLVSENGNLTDLGRRVQADQVAKGKEGTFEALVDAVLDVRRAEKAAEDLENSANGDSDRQ